MSPFLSYILLCIKNVERGISIQSFNNPGVTHPFAFLIIGFHNLYQFQSQGDTNLLFDHKEGVCYIAAHAMQAHSKFVMQIA